MPGMAKTARLELRVEPALLDRIDHARGDVPRARFVERALEAALDSINYLPAAKPKPRASLTGRPTGPRPKNR